MKEVAGGLWFAGLLAWALLGIVPGIILLLLGTGAASWKLGRELQAAKAAASWRKNYPPYGY